MNCRTFGITLIWASLVLLILSPVSESARKGVRKGKAKYRKYTVDRGYSPAEYRREKKITNNKRRDKKRRRKPLTEDAAREDDLLVGCAFSNIATEFRTIDGTFNNRRKPNQGASNTAFAQTFPPLFDDGFNLPRGSDRSRLYNGFPLPLTRDITVEFGSDTFEDDPYLTNMHFQFGQFVAHDLVRGRQLTCPVTRAACFEACEYEEPCFPIITPDNDPFIDSEEECRINAFVRNVRICGTGTSKKRPSVSNNAGTSYLDASVVYGHTADTAIRIRDPLNFALLRTGTNEYATSVGKPLLPFQADDERDIIVCVTRQPVPRPCFVAGDRAVNQNTGLLILHTIFVREHNRIALRLKEINPFWNAEKVYQEARKILGAVLQHITYKEYLPAILPDIDETLGKYRGYDRKVDSSVFDGFATGAFRFHHIIKPFINRIGPDYEPIDTVLFNETLFAPGLIVDSGIDAFTRGNIAIPAKKASPLKMIHQDLLSKIRDDFPGRDIQRGRGRGENTYNTWRSYCGLPSCDGEGFDCYKNEIREESVRHKLENLYGTTKNVEIWIGGFSEDPVEGGVVGPTFKCILTEQFRRFRDGDSFWYERKKVFSRQQLKEIRKVSLARIICDNSDDIKRVPKNVFRISDPSTYLSCQSIKEMDLEKWKVIDTCTV